VVSLVMGEMTVFNAVNSFWSMVFSRVVEGEVDQSESKIKLPFYWS
jgi:hypothetical protein